VKVQIKKLSEVAEINPGRPSIDRADGQMTSFIPMINVDAVKGEVSIVNAEPYSKVKKGYTFFQSGDVIFAKITPCMQNGKHAVVRGLSDGFGFGSTEFHVVRASDAIISEWIHFFLRRKETLDAAKRTFTGAVGQQRVPASFLENLELPMPTVEKQQQVVIRLKAQLAEVEKARQAAEKQLADASFLVARHQEVSLNELGSAPRVSLGELLLGIEAGKSFKTTDMPARPDELAILKVSAVSWNKFQPQEAKSVEGDYRPDEKHRVKKGDLIISRANTIELIGAVVRVPEDYPLRLLSDKTLRLVTKTDKVLPDYLLTVLKWPEARAHIESYATGTSDSMRNISQKTIRSIPIPLLSKDEQQAIINSSKAVNHELDQIRGSTIQMLNDLALLPQKILAQAFSLTSGEGLS